MSQHSGEHVCVVRSSSVRSRGGERRRPFGDELLVHVDVGSCGVGEREDLEALAHHALKRAAADRRGTLQRVMRESLEVFSLANTARAYIDVYEKLIAEGPATFSSS